MFNRFRGNQKPSVYVGQKQYLVAWVGKTKTKLGLDDNDYEYDEISSFFSVMGIRTTNLTVDPAD